MVQITHKEDSILIDLRSDTLTMPDAAMLETILTARLGDDGRLDENGRGEDEEINRLEDECAALTGKEAGLLSVSGTMGNQTALMTWCGPGDQVLVERRQHLYKSEEAAFSDRLSRMQPVFYTLDDALMPDLPSMEAALAGGSVRLVCVENSHNFSGGACITTERMKAIRELADRYHVPVHLDGARLFNAAAYLHADIEELCRYADSVMFCFSKGLAAPVGSILCGSHSFIRRAKETRKLLGGALRQGGIIAAPARYALAHNRPQLAEDNRNCRICADALSGLKRLSCQTQVQTNILVLNISRTGLTQKEICRRLADKGLLIKPVLDEEVRLVFYKGITADDARQAAAIILSLDRELEETP